MVMSKQCAYCQNRAVEKMVWVLGARAVAEIPVCGAHYQAIDDKDWTHQVRCGDMVSVITGKDYGK